MAVTVVVGGLLFAGAARMASSRGQLGLAAGELQQARRALTDRDDDKARTALDGARRHLAAARDDARAFPMALVGPIPLLNSAGRAVRDTVKAGDESVAAGRILVDASSSFPTSASTALDGHDLSPFHAAAVRSEEALAEAARHLDRARTALDGPAAAVIPQLSGPARAARSDLDRSSTQIDAAGRGLALLAQLTAPDTEFRLLLLSQDSLELRPTGGFIGSYGVLAFSHGTVRLERYDDVHNLPPADPPMMPPAALAQVIPDQWGLGNVNWWPDFPTTAATAREMFKRQGGGQVDGVLALTEYATARLVGAVGPLKLPSYDKPVTEDGFDARTVYEVELKRPLDNPRKQFLIELSNVLFDRIFHLPADRLPTLAKAVGQSVGAGDLQLWFADPSQEAALAGTAVAGRLPSPSPSHDFLLLVDSNMTASKANMGLTKQATYRVRRDADGRLVAQLTVKATNDAAKSPVNPFYNGYLRVYVPPGSHLLHPSATQVEQKASDGPYQVFAQRLLVQPGGEQTVTFDYVLPASMAHGGAYRLDWLRQVGTPRDTFEVDVGGRSARSDPGARVLELTSTVRAKGRFSWLPWG